MEITTNFGLEKPCENDLYGDFIPEIFSKNMDKIDALFFELSQKSGGLSSAFADAVIQSANGFTAQVTEKTQTEV